MKGKRRDGERPAIPLGWRELRLDEEPSADDMCFNIIVEKWEPIPETVLVRVSLFGSAPFWFPPIRKEEK